MRFRAVCAQSFCASIGCMLLCLLLISTVRVSAQGTYGTPAENRPVTGCGSVEVSGHPEKTCPLERTTFAVDVSGYVADVLVKQRFRNTSKAAIDATYTFPLNESASVYEMVFRNGKRCVRSEIRRKEEAARLYEQARKEGRTTALLQQQRPNVFTQSMANIAGHTHIDVEIRYTQYCSFDKGQYHLVLPTVVGPRFLSGGEDTETVKAFTRPLVSATRPGNDVNIEVNIDAGVKIGKIHSDQHQIFVSRNSPTKARVDLFNGSEIPNRDFSLSWEVSAVALQTSYLVHKRSDHGYVSILLVPPKPAGGLTTVPQEIIFLIDRSGSQSGFPINAAKRTAMHIIRHLRAEDTFQIMSFSEAVQQLFPTPQPATPITIAQAAVHLGNMEADGGTYMKEAVERCCALPAAKNRLRTVVFMTDGYVGADFEVIGLVKKLRDRSRWFVFGTGSGVNRFLVENVAKFGGGEAQYVLENTEPSRASDEFWQKVCSPVASDLTLTIRDTAGHTLETYPKDKSDVWLQRPLFFTAEYRCPGAAVATLTGVNGRGEKFAQEINLSLPSAARGNENIRRVWARQKIDHLMSTDWCAVQNNTIPAALKEQIVRTSLAHRVLTQYTSFVAVDRNSKVSRIGAATVEVPTESPSLRCIGINGTYRGIHQFFNDDLIGNVFSQLGQLIGKWISEFVNGWCSDSLEICSGTLVSIVAMLGFKSGLAPYTIGGALLLAMCIGLRPLVQKIISGKTASAAGFKQQLHQSSPILGCTILCTLITVCSELPNWQMTPVALSSALKGCILAGVGGLTSAMAPLLGSLTLGFIGATIGQIIAFIMLVLICICGCALALEFACLALFSACAIPLVLTSAICAPVLTSLPNLGEEALHDRLLAVAMRGNCVLLLVCADLALINSFCFTDGLPIAKIGACLLSTTLVTVLISRICKPLRHLLSNLRISLASLHAAKHKD